MVGTVECSVTMELQIAHKTQRHVALGPGDVVVAVTREFAGSTNVYSGRQREAGCVTQQALYSRHA